MIIEEIMNFLSRVIEDLDRSEFILSIMIFVLPSAFKLIKSKFRKYYVLINGFLSYFFIMILLNSIIYKSTFLEGYEFLTLILIGMFLKEVYFAIRNKKFTEVYEALEDYNFYKNIDIDIVGFKFTEHDSERIKFMIRSNFNVLALYHEIGDLKVKIENKKTYLNLELDFKFNKSAKDYEIENIVSRYEELENIKYIDSFSYNNKLDKIEITIKDENN